MEATSHGGVLIARYYVQKVGRSTIARPSSECMLAQDEMYLTSQKYSRNFKYNID